MAKKRRPSPLDEPPTASSSDSEDDQQPPPQQQEDEAEDEEEEEAASSEEEEGSSEEDDEEDQPPAPSQPAVKNPPPPPTGTNSHPKPSSSESDSGSDTDSDADAEADPPPPANPKVKPLASKPMDQTPKARAPAQPSPAPARSATKRAAAAENNAHANDPKRAKKKATDAAAAAAGGGSDEEVEEDGKKSGDESRKLFQRLWSEEDEVAILKGLADFASRTGNDPLKYANEFHDFVKKSLHVDASNNQLKQKIRRLKKKFEISAGLGKNGEDPTFSKPRDQKAFELSKKVWGTNEADEKAKPNGKPAKSAKKETTTRNAASAKKPPPAKKPMPETRVEPEPEVPSVDLKDSGKMEVDKVADTSLILSEMFRFDKGVGPCGLNEDVVKRGVGLMGESKRAELEGRWQKLHVAELELFVKRAELIEDQARLILEAYKSSSH